MKLVSFAAMALVISTASGWARLGESIDQLYKRYGTASQLHDKEGGLTVVEFNKGSIILTFELLDLKAEGLEAKGLINKDEAEVIMARNIPNQTFEIDVNPATPPSSGYVFWHTYTFSDGSVAIYFKRRDSDSGQTILRITSPKKQAYDKWRKEHKKAEQNAEANRKIDLLETPETAIAKTNVHNLKQSSPTIFRDIKLISTGAHSGQDDSFPSMDTALGRYQNKLYQAVFSRWNLKAIKPWPKSGLTGSLCAFM